MSLLTLLAPRPVVSSGDGSLADVVASTVFDLDATIVDSYPGTGTTWANLVVAPADGSDQTAYDFYTGNGSTDTTYPAFNGTPGDSAAYWGFDGGDYFNIKTGANTAFLNALHKTTGGTAWWVACAFRTPESLGNCGFFQTATNNATPGCYMFAQAGGNVRVLQRGNTGFTTKDPIASGAVDDAESDYIAIISYDPTANAYRGWANTATATTTDNANFNACTSNAAVPLTLGRGGGSVMFLAGARMYSFAMGNAYLDNTGAAAIMAALEARHGRDYTP